MMFTNGETVVQHSRSVTGRDVDGNDVYTSTDITIEACGFAPGGSTELVQGQDIVTVQPMIFAPAGTIVKPIDQFTARGVLYDVDAGSNDWRSPFTGWNPGVVIKLKEVTG